MCVHLLLPGHQDGSPQGCSLLHCMRQPIRKLPRATDSKFKNAQGVRKQKPHGKDMRELKKRNILAEKDTAHNGRMTMCCLVAEQTQS